MPPHDIERGPESGVAIRPEDLRIGIGAARAAGAVSEALLTALRPQVLAGRYRPPAQAVAQRMLRELAWGRLGGPTGAPADGE